jgi:hypothetical protein
MVDLGATTPWRRSAMFPEYRDRSLPEVFRELVAACGDRTAVRDGKGSLSYRALHESIEAAAGATLGESVHDTSARRAFDGCGPVVRGVLIAAGEAAHVAGEADQVASDHGSDAEDVGHGRVRCLHGDADPSV